MKLQYPVTLEGEEKPLPYLYLDIPYHIQFGLHKTQEEYKKEVLEVLRIETGTMLEMIGFFGFLLATDDNYKSNSLGDFIVTLSKISSSLQTAVEMVEMRFLDAQEEKRKSNAQPMQNHQMF